MNNTENKKEKKGLSKKGSIIIISVLGILLVVLALLNTLDFEKIFNDMFDKGVETPTYNYFFYEPDYETNILDDPEYLELDRTISYTEGAVTYKATDLDKFFGTAVLGDILRLL